MKLDKCVSTVLLGFQCINDALTSSQFLYVEGDTKRNFLGWTNFAEYILRHFAMPGSTILDLTDDPKGMYILCVYCR